MGLSASGMVKLYVLILLLSYSTSDLRYSIIWKLILFLSVWRRVELKGCPLLGSLARDWKYRVKFCLGYWTCYFSPGFQFLIYELGQLVFLFFRVFMSCSDYCARGNHTVLSGSWTLRPRARIAHHPKPNTTCFAAFSQVLSLAVSELEKSRLATW